MATALLPSQIDDLTNTTLVNWEPGKSWVDISLSYPNFIYAREMAKRNRFVWNGGYKYKWVVQVNNDTNTRMTGLWDDDQNATRNLSIEATIECAFITTNFAMDTREEVFNSGIPQIVDYIKMRKHSMYNDYFQFMENKMWTAPASSTETPSIFYGVPWWLQLATSSQTTFGFNGVNPSGFTAGRGNISSTTYTSWANGNAYFTALSRENFLALLKEATTKSNFIAPDPFTEMGKAGTDFGFYTTYQNLAGLELLQESRNDNLGSDLDKYRGVVMYRGNPVWYVPAIDTTSQPFYGINWSNVKFAYVSGADRQISPVITPTDSHKKRITHMDTSTQLIFENLRTSFVLNQ